MDAYSGKFLFHVPTPANAFFVPRFGLLHRIPPIPENREPGALPPELAEQEEYEEQQLFVPADLTGETETPEQAEERLQWEQEEREREAYARNYAAAVNQTSPSAYDLSLDSEHLASYHGTDPASERNTVNLSEAASSGTLSQRSPSARSGRQQPEPVLPVKLSSRSSTPVHTPLFSSPRASTPTQNRSLGYHVNGESRNHVTVQVPEPF